MKSPTQSTQSISPIQNAQARHHTYTLFSRLFLQGITADLLPYLQAIPELAAVLPDPFDPDETAAAHHTLFAFNIFPNAAIFLDSSRLLGGPITNAHADLFRRSGFTPDSAVEPDHLSQSFAFLAVLSENEANALASNRPPPPYQTRQLHFLENHLLPSLIPCTIAIQQQDNPFYTQLSQLALALIADHYANTQPTAGSGHQPNQPITSRFRPLPNYEPVPTITHSPSLQDNHTSLRDIARYLVTPVLSGIYLGRSDLTRLARRLNLPHGFGRRDQMLQTLLQSAGQYDTAPNLFAALQDLLAVWQQAYQQIADDYPETAAHIPPWQNRLQQTQHLLARMQEASEQVSK